MHRCSFFFFFFVYLFLFQCSSVTTCTADQHTKANEMWNTELRKSWVAYIKRICHPSSWWYCDIVVGLWPSTGILVEINPKSSGTRYINTKFTRICNYIQISTLHGRYITDYTCRYVLKLRTLLSCSSSNVSLKKCSDLLVSHLLSRPTCFISVITTHTHTHTTRCDQIVNDSQILASLMPKLFMTQLLH